MKDLVEVFVRRMFSFIVIGCSFICAFYPNIIELFYGPKFQGAALSGVIMMLYPMHQVYGQLIGGTFYATGKTSIYSRITISAAILSLGLSYLFMVKYNLGANGMALKLVITQFLTVSVINFVFNRSLGINSNREMLKDFSVLIFMLGGAFLLRYMLDLSNPIFALLAGAAVYILFCVVTIFIFPKIFGFRDRSQFFNLFRFKPW
ncbi:MAG: hypothetical protein EOO46_05775 [Flavobacterium sp.]|nr:MAG: hypothetical protein EOO46_05775 [Flavobacterium sp.]